MSSAEVDDYLDGLDEPHASTLRAVRAEILRLLPEAEEGISYGLPVVRVRGTAVVGLGAFTRHLSWLPHSGSVLPAMGDRLTGWTRTAGALHFPVDQPLPAALVRELLDVRMRQAGLL